MDTQTKLKKILVVEDDIALQSVLSDKLTDEHFVTVVASDGKEGLEVAEKELPDIILLDILMPKMNGMEMLKKLRETKWGKSIPVLLLTNDTEPERMMLALKNNASDYLIKADWGLVEVVKKIKETLGI